MKLNENFRFVARDNPTLFAKMVSGATWGYKLKRRVENSSRLASAPECTEFESLSGIVVLRYPILTNLASANDNGEETKSTQGGEGLKTQEGR